MDKHFWHSGTLENVHGLYTSKMIISILGISGTEPAFRASHLFGAKLLIGMTTGHVRTTGTYSNAWSMFSGLSRQKMLFVSNTQKKFKLIPRSYRHLSGVPKQRTCSGCSRMFWVFERVLGVRACAVLIPKINKRYTYIHIYV